MVRALLTFAINLVTAAIALLIAASVVDGVTVSAAGFLTAVVIFAVAQALLFPFVFKMATKYASAVLGGVGLVSTVLALWIATLFPGGLEITGTTAWVATPVLVWLITALGGWVLSYFIITRWWQRRRDAERIRRATAN